MGHNLSEGFPCSLFMFDHKCECCACVHRLSVCHLKSHFILLDPIESNALMMILYSLISTSSGKETTKILVEN